MSQVTPEATLQITLADAALVSNPFPQIGAFVRNEYDKVHAGVNITRLWIEGWHRTHYRVSGGSAGLWQRCLVYVRNAPPDVNPLPPGNIDLILGGEIWPTPTGWSAFARNNGTYTYYFGGQFHRNGGWHWDSGLRERKDFYNNGVLWTLSYDDTGDHPDYDDLIIEVAVVWGISSAPSEIIGAPVPVPDVQMLTVDKHSLAIK